MERTDVVVVTRRTPAREEVDVGVGEHGDQETKTESLPVLGLSDLEVLVVLASAEDKIQLRIPVVALLWSNSADGLSDAQRRWTKELNNEVSDLVRRSFYRRTGSANEARMEFTS